MNNECASIIRYLSLAPITVYCVYVCGGGGHNGMSLKYYFLILKLKSWDDRLEMASEMNCLPPCVCLCRCYL